VLARQRGGEHGKPLRYPSNLPTALSMMTALRELELLAVDYMSAAPEQELSAAPQPGFSQLTSLRMSCDGRSFIAYGGTALWLWLGWMLPAAPLLCKLSVSSEHLSAGGWVLPFQSLDASPDGQHGCPFHCGCNVRQCLLMLQSSLSGVVLDTDA